MFSPRALALCAGALLLATSVDGAAVLPSDLTLSPYITTGLSAPIAVRNAHDGSNRLFVVNRGGQVLIVPDGATAPLPTPFLSINGAGSTPPSLGFSQSGEGGLLGLAFHPNFASNGYVYIDYTDARVDTVVARYTVSAADPNRLDPASEVILLRIDQDFTNHKAGDIYFGPDGFLYVALGDGGGGGDTCHRAQTLDPAQLSGAASGGSSASASDCKADDDFLDAALAPRGNASSRALLGKLLRLDVDNVTAAGANDLCAASPLDGSANYAVPSGNPFAGGGTANGCGEVWDYGLRNPFRFSFDRLTGDLYIGDVGQGAMEEINREPLLSPGGNNYGWNNCEGTLNFNGNCAGSVAPILTYTPSENAAACAAITGGYRYRGPIGNLAGTYIFGDYCSGKIHFASLQAGGIWTRVLFTSLPTNSTVSFGEDEAGNLFSVDITRGRVLKFSSNSVFFDGFED